MEDLIKWLALAETNQCHSIAFMGGPSQVAVMMRGQNSLVQVGSISMSEMQNISHQLSQLLEKKINIQPSTQTVGQKIACSKLQAVAKSKLNFSYQRIGGGRYLMIVSRTECPSLYTDLYGKQNEEDNSLKDHKQDAKLANSNFSSDTGELEFSMPLSNKFKAIMQEFEVRRDPLSERGCFTPYLGMPGLTAEQYKTLVITFD